MKYKDIISKMTLEDKIALCSGKDFWHTKDFAKYGIPSISMTDGPHGVRKQRADADMLGINDSVPATCFPTAVTSGATWNRKLIEEEGRAIGEEAKKEKVAVVLGPGVNIKRNPLCGRNFEYFSEDPYVAGEMGAAFVKGMQSTGIGTSLKHFAANSQEYKRFSSDSQIDERTLREIYLSAFERVVKEAKPATVMCAYDKINGTYCSDNKKLLTDILRKEWGFDGMVVTDWGAMGDRTLGFKAGCDLSMPGGSAYQEDEVLENIKSGRLDEKYIDNSVDRILEVVFNGDKTLKTDEDYDIRLHQELACKIASEGAVLLKNEDNILPVKEEKIVLIGHMAEEIRYQGSGSSHINPTKLLQVTDYMKDAEYIEGCDADGNITESRLKEVTKGAQDADIAIVFAGLTPNYESEGFDRDNMEIPEGHNKMIEAALKGNSNTVVVLMGGSAMILSWFDKVKAVLYMGLCGQSGGKAIADIIKGRVNPSGKLTETWPLKEEDVPSYGFYGGIRKNAQYREGIYVGYRYYDKAEVKVRFPFGFGMSYTEFEYSDLVIKGNDVTATIKNIGSTAGAEVVQLYVEAPQDGIYRAVKELKGFDKVYLEPGQSSTVTFKLDERSFALFADGWLVPKGRYNIMIGSSSQDIRLNAEIIKDGTEIKKPQWQMESWYENPKGHPSKEDFEKLMGRKIEEDPVLRKGNFEINNTLLELKDYNFIAKMICSIIEKSIAKGMGVKPDYSDEKFRMAAASSVDCSMRGIIISSCGKFPKNLAECIVEMANGHKIKGIKKLLNK